MITRAAFRLITWIKVRFKFIISAILIVIIVDHLGILSHLLEVDYARFSYPLDVPMEEVLAAMRTGIEPPHTPINKYDYFYKIRSEKKCRQTNSEEHENVVILYVIKSALNHHKRRDAIRRTWGWENRFSDVTIRRIFVLGLSVDDDEIQENVNEEQARNKDIVQAEFIDSYYNNTIKTMMSFRWVLQNCPKAKFIVFSDDDMYVSTKNMLKFIRSTLNKRVGLGRRRDIETVVSEQIDFQSKPELSDKTYNKELNFPDPILSSFDKRLFAGFVFNSSPMRHKSSKWYITLDEYRYSKYPPYVTAGAYVLSYRALVDMYYTSLFTKHFKFDDIYLGIVAKKCNISPFHNEHFHFWKKAYDKDAYSTVIASHGYGDPSELKLVWEEQRSLGHA